MEDNYYKINDFGTLVENYYKDKGKDIVFKFLHMIVKYTYIYSSPDTMERYIDGNDNFKEKERVVNGVTNVRKTEEERIFVPVVVERQTYEEKKDILFDLYGMNPVTIRECIDIGGPDNFNYDEYYKTVKQSIPKGCTIVDDNTLLEIANLNGYDKFGWKIYDASIGKPAIAFCCPEWTYDVYGIKKSKKETK